MKTSVKQTGLIALSFLATLGSTLALFFLLKPTSKDSISEENKTMELSINAPIENGLPFEIVKFNTKDGLVFHRSNGTHVEIPANSIVDNNGASVYGEVEFRFREMQNAKEIFLSGIPMQMKSDRTSHLQSMGMVELRVFKENQELKLKSGSSLKVDIASEKKPDENFDLWVLTDDNNWEQKGTFETVQNTRRDNALKRLPKKPKKPKKPKDNFIFQLASDENMPHLAVWNNVDWQLLGTQNAHKLNRALRINWDKIEIKTISERKRTFEISFISQKMDHQGKIYRDSITISATPDIEKKDMKKLLAAYNSALKDFEIVLKKRQEEEDRLLNETALLNSFRANGFGIYNIDKIEQTKILAKMNATFDFQSDINEKINNIKLIMICKNQNTVLTYYPSEWVTLPVLDDEIELVALLPNGEFAYVSGKEFNKQIRMNDIHPSFENKRFFHSTSISKDELRKKMT